MTCFRSLAACAARLGATAAVLAFAAVSLTATGADKPAPAPLTGEAAAVKKVLEQKFPGAEIRGITKSPYFGLYEVQLDDRLVYTDAKAKYLLVGSVYDTESKTNLTEDRQRKLNRVDVATLPLDMAIKKVKGTGERTLYVFADADCPFCAKLEHEMKSVDNVTIYTFLYPIDTLHPDSARKSRIIWCSDDRAKAWDAYYDSGALPDNKGDCDNPLAKTAELGAKYRVNATPTLVFADGIDHSGRHAGTAARSRTQERRLRSEEARRGEEVACRKSPRNASNGEDSRAMAILDFIKKQFIDIIEWTDDSRDTLSYRFPDEDKEIKNGAQLIVRESQVAQFVYLGQFGDTFGPGKYTLTTDNIPILSDLKGWKYGLEARSRPTSTTSSRGCSPATSGARPIP